MTAALVAPQFAAAAYKIEKIDVANVTNKDFVVGPGKVELEINPLAKVKLLQSQFQIEREVQKL